MSLNLNADDRLLFIGDSITDCGRGNDPEGLGTGYVRMIRDALLARDPATTPTVLNRGISGHRILELADRWDRDVIASDPTCLSIKIGINDVWRQLDGRAPGVPIDDYRAIYADLLQRTLDALPRVRLVLCEPTVIWEPASPTPTRGNELLQPYVAAVNALAEKFDARVVPLHQAFEKARARRPDAPWAPDGVHPGSPGHALIARTWLEAVTGRV